MKRSKNQPTRGGRKTPKKFGRKSQAPPTFFEDAASTLPARSQRDESTLEAQADQASDPLNTEMGTLRDAAAPSDAPDTSAPAASNSKTSDAAFSASKGLMSGVRWNTLSIILNQVMTLTRSIILARLLEREDFGLMGMVASVQGGLALFTNFGLRNTIISGNYKDGEELDRQLNTIFTVEILRSALLTLILMAVSVPTAQFYGDDRLRAMMMITCLTPLIASFENIGLSLLAREAKFRDSTIYNLIKSFLTIVVSLLIAFWRRDVWALVWAQTAAAVISVAFSYCYHPYRPRFRLDPTVLRSSLKFGGWFMVISAMYYITSTADNILVGKLLGPAVLGAYLVAYNVAQLPSTLVSKMLGNVLFPIFARLGRDDIGRLREAVSRVLVIGTSALTLVIVPMMLLVPELVSVLYGAKWSDAVAPLRVLLLVGLFRGLIQLISPLMMSQNRPDMEAKSKIVEAVTFLAILYPMVLQFGTVGAAWAGALIYFLALLMRYRFANALVPGAFGALFSTLLSVGAAAALGALAGFGLLHLLGGTWPIVRLLVVGPTVFAVTASFLVWFRKDLRREMETVGVTPRVRALFKRA